MEVNFLPPDYCQLWSWEFLVGGKSLVYFASICSCGTSIGQSLLAMLKQSLYFIIDIETLSFVHDVQWMWLTVEGRLSLFPFSITVLFFIYASTDSWIYFYLAFHIWETVYIVRVEIMEKTNSDRREAEICFHCSKVNALFPVTEHAYCITLLGWNVLFVCMRFNNFNLLRALCLFLHVFILKKHLINLFRK